MEAPCLAHKFERLQTTSDGPRPEIRPNLMREGEVTPFKICVAILLREHYSLQQTGDPTPEDRIAALKCLHELVTIPDLNFSQFKAVLLNTVHCLRPEVVQSVLSILQELDRNNLGFLTDFANTMIEVNQISSSITILKKKIGKNGVYGKFIRMVLMGIRRMSYAQMQHTYRELGIYIGLVYNIKSSPNESVDRKLPRPPPPSSFATKEIVTMEQDGQPQTILQTESQSIDALEQTLSDTQIGEDDDDLDDGSEEENIPEISVSPQKYPKTTHSPTLTTLSPSKLDFPSATTSSVGLGAEVEVKTILSTPASITKPIGFIFDRMEKMVPYDSQLTFNAQTLAAPVPNKDTEPKHGLDVFEEMRTARIERGAVGLGPSLASNFAHRLGRLQSAPLHGTSANGSDAMDVDGVEPSPQPGRQREPAGEEANGSTGSLANCNPKWWSRRLIESTIKTVTRAVEFGLEPRTHSSRDVATFVEQAKHNPSANVLLPQLHYMDYMSALELKDISRAHESLRTSFDLRIKPTTSELSRAIPYASYNFAVFYDRLGYEEDAKMFLEEAFQSGHSAADEMCLEYCNNLWAHFEGAGAQKQRLKRTPGTGGGTETTTGSAAGTTTATAAAKGATHLNVLRSIGVVLDKLRNGSTSQMRLLEELYKCVPTFPAGGVVDIAEVLVDEALQAEALITMFMTFGWHDWARRTCEAILDQAEEFGWPSRTYCTAICTLGHINLLAGDPEEGRRLFAEGERRFGSETNPTGELFNTQQAIFQATTYWLAAEPLPDSLLATFAAFDSQESMYWLAYNNMHFADYNEALMILRQLSCKLESQHQSPIAAVDLQIRSLLLQAEIYCLAGSPTAALSYHFQALELAERIHSDYYILLGKITLACVQHALGLYNQAARTLLPFPVSHLLCTSPYIKARLNLIGVKLFLGMEDHDPVRLFNNQFESREKSDRTYGDSEILSFIMRICPTTPVAPSPAATTATSTGRRASTRRSSSSGSGSSGTSQRTSRRRATATTTETQQQQQQPPADDVQKFRDLTAERLLELLHEVEDIFSVWGNRYRMKELLWLRRQVVQEFQPTQKEKIKTLEAEFNTLVSDADTCSLPWNPKTCIM